MMMRNTRRHRASALPTAMIIMVAVGVYAIALPNVSTAFQREQIQVQNERVAYSAAVAGLELGRSQMYYLDMLGFRNLLGQTLALPAQYLNGSGVAVINGAEVTVEVLDNDDGNSNFDIDLTYEVRSTAVYNNVEVVVAHQVTIASAANYNFSSSNYWGGNWNSGLATRTFYGNVYYTSPLNNIWWFLQPQYFHGTVESLGFGAYQSGNAYFPKPGGGYYTLNEARNQGLLKEYATYDDMPKVGAVMDILNQLNPDTSNGGDPANAPNMYGEAARNNTLISDNVEIFLAPHGEIWTRPFGGDPGMYHATDNPTGWSVMTDSSGQPLQQDGQTIVVEGNALVRGFVTGAISIGADSMIINGTIRNMDYTTSHLGLVAKEAIYFENREIVPEVKVAGVQVTPPMILAPRPVEQGVLDTIGNVSGGLVVSATDPAKLGTTSSATTLTGGVTDLNLINPAQFNFIAQPILPTSEWNQLKNNYIHFSSRFPGITQADWNDLVRWELFTHNESANDGSYHKGRMPKSNAIVEASMVSGWWISPAVTYLANAAHRYNTQGGTITFRGTYSMGAPVDMMATWSYNPLGSNGMVSYDQHPYQLLTAPHFFVPVTAAYPRALDGTFRLVSMRRLP